VLQFNKKEVKMNIGENFYEELDLIGLDSKIDIFQNNDIKKVDINNFKGKWVVLFFYPADFTFICPTELSELADKYSDFVSEGAEVISVSRDSAFVHKAWSEKDPRIGKISYPMAADVKGDLTELFDVFEEPRGMSLRATLIIDPEGFIVSKDVNDNSIGRNIDEILRKLQAAKFTRSNSGEVCPVNWTPKSDSLKLPELSILK
tara:strand:+ start:2666 stop:3277 length:612 start_codon:yes stop_codon:yes gene_type:complete